MDNTPALNPEIMSSLILKGDMSGLSSQQRVQYVTNLCQRLGLDPLTQPFKILKLQGREVLYADKGATQQLCKIYGISTEITKREKIEDIYIVSVRASDKNGRFSDEDGAVTIGTSKGDTLANAMMKAVTKAKRRAVLAFCGLGMLDETEVETIKGASIEKITPEETPVEVKIEESLKDPLPVVTHKVDHIDTSDLEDIAIRVFKGKKSGMKAWLKDKFQVESLEELKSFSRESCKTMLLEMEIWQGSDKTQKELEKNENL